MKSEDIPFTCSFSAMPRPGHVILLGSRNATLSMIAGVLPVTSRLGRPVVDQTGLSGRYDFTLEWSPEPGDPFSAGTESPAEAQGAPFLEALKDQLGLKLKATRAPVQVLVIDHVEEPSEN